MSCESGRIIIGGGRRLVITACDGRSVVVTRPTVRVLSVARQGPPGPPGPQGPAGPAGGAYYTHTQASAASSWTIHHSLGRYPSVTVVDSSGREVHGDVAYLSSMDITVTFSAPFAGVAYLN